MSVSMAELESEGVRGPGRSLMRDNLVVGGREAWDAVGLRRRDVRACPRGRKFRMETVPLFLGGHLGFGQRRQPGQCVGLWAACIGERDFAKGVCGAGSEPLPQMLKWDRVGSGTPQQRRK